MIEFAADTTIRINIFLCIIGMRYLVPLIICSTLPSHMLSPAKAAARQQYFDAMSRRKLGLW